MLKDEVHYYFLVIIKHFCIDYFLSKKIVGEFTVNIIILCLQKDSQIDKYK